MKFEMILLTRTMPSLLKRGAEHPWPLLNSKKGRTKPIGPLTNFWKYGGGGRPPWHTPIYGPVDIQIFFKYQLVITIFTYNVKLMW